ncbi:MAG: hypothetical protein F4Z25_08230 [Chloroflexi bacterium]|nr:hypothetical protein [Chloroflexota bacterium]
MSKMIQIRNVPDELHREAKVRAARAGMTLSGYLLRELERTLAEPTMEELLARIAAWEPPELSESPAEAVRAIRDER